MGKRYLTRTGWALFLCAASSAVVVACDAPGSPTATYPEGDAGAPSSDGSSGAPPAEAPAGPFKVSFAASAAPEAVGSGGGSVVGSGGTAGGGPPVLSAPFGLSISCGDAIVGAEEECDDGDGGADGCNGDCRTRDQAVAAVTGGRDRSLGEGRHPVSGLNGGFIATFVEVPPVDRWSTDGVQVGATLFDIWGRKKHQVVVSAGALPVDDANPVAAALPNGDYAVAWSDFDGDGSDLGIALRRVKSDGSLGSLATANARREFTQRNPDVLWVGNQLVVAWEDYADPNTGPDLRYRLFDASLNPLGADQVLAGSPQPEGAVALAPFAGSWAAAYREGGVVDSFGRDRETIVIQAKTKTFRVGPVFAGPAEDRPALGELDPTHLLVVFTEGTDPASSGVYNTPRLRYAVIDTESSAPPTWQALELLEPLFAADSRTSFTSPSVAQGEDGLYLAWRSEARAGDSAGDQLWLKRVRWDSLAVPPTGYIGEAEVLVPRDCEGSVGDQRAPALAPVALPPHGALALAWDDYAHTQGTTAGDPDVVVHFAPVRPRDIAAPRYFKETWTGPTSSPWPARWSNQTTVSSGTDPITIDIRANEGRVATTGSHGLEYLWVNDQTALNVDLKVKVRVNLNSVWGGLIARRADEDPQSFFSFWINTNANPMALAATIGGVGTTIKEAPLPALFNYYARSLDHYLRFRVVTEADNSIKLAGKIWLTELPEPAAWSIESTIPATGASAIRDRLGRRPGRFGVSGAQYVTNRSTTFDDFEATYYPGNALGPFRDAIYTSSPEVGTSVPQPLPRATDGDGCCSNDGECGPGLACTSSMNEYLKLGSHETACVADHCTNRTLDTSLGEVRVDCGGPDCAPCTCSTAPIWGQVGHCTAACPCGIGGVDCATNADCLPGLMCVQEAGWRYGGPEGSDACTPQHCWDRTLNADETGPLPDWGGSCGNNRCYSSPNGGYAHCSVSCPCPVYEGDCDYSDECQPGLVCTSKGANFGVAFNICLLPHCADKKKNFDETGIDCGGADCGPICP